VDRCRNGPGFHNDIDGNSTIQEILIPASKVGLVIGKGGETIKQLQVCEPYAAQNRQLPCSGPSCICPGEDGYDQFPNWSGLAPVVLRLLSKLLLESERLLPPFSRHMLSMYCSQK
jgi:hypothetical protein